MLDQSFIEANTEGFGEFTEFLKDYNLEKASEVSGIDYAELDRLARLIGSGKRVSFWWTMGLIKAMKGSARAVDD